MGTSTKSDTNQGNSRLPDEKEWVGAHDLLGESESSVAAAGQRDLNEIDGDDERDLHVSAEDGLSVDPEDMGSHFLENATEAPPHVEPRQRRDEEESYELLD